MKTKKSKKVLSIIAIVLAVLLLGGTIGMHFLAAYIYDSNFNFRCTTDEDIFFDISEFPSMTRQRHTFASNNGQTLVGYLYQQADTQSKAVVVFAHGMGAGGQTGYMDIFHYLTTRGYAVFAYDATANDESEGEVLGGFPQGVIDLDHAIDYAYTIPEIQDLPVVLMGYSWGAFSVTNVLNFHPEVAAVVSAAGWNKSMDLIGHFAYEVAGNASKLALPFAARHERSLFGEAYTSCSAMDGFAASDCNVMIIHGQQDDVVPITIGYETYYAQYGTDPRFEFKKYPDRDHAILDNLDETRDFQLMQEIADFFDRSLPA